MNEETEDIDVTELLHSVKSDRLMLFNNLMGEYADPMDFGMLDFEGEQVEDFCELLKTRLCGKGQAWQGMRLCVILVQGRPVFHEDGFMIDNVLHIMKASIHFSEVVLNCPIHNKLVTQNDRLNWLFKE